MIAFVVGVLVGWAALAVIVGLLIGAVISNAEKPAPELVTPEPDGVYAPQEWTA